jgi:hypothetical protein
VTDAQCTQVRDAMARSPNAQTTLQGLRGRVQAGEIDQQRSRVISDSIYKALGVDAMVARACQFRGRQGGDRSGRTGGAAQQATAPSGSQSAATNSGGGRRGGRRGNAAALMEGMAVPTSQASPRRQQARPALVYVASGTSFVPRVVRVGMSDLDYTEVVSGIQEGENVLLMSALVMQASRDSAMARMRARGGGMPGAPAAGGPGGPGGGRGRGP